MNSTPFTHIPGGSIPIIENGKIIISANPNKIVSSNSTIIQPPIIKSPIISLSNIQKPFDVKHIHNVASKWTAQEQSLEWYKCKINPFYFIYNYVFIPEIGGILKYEKSIMNGKIKQVVRSVIRFHRCILMASRQLGKSTIAACILEWANNFYPNARAIILNATKDYAFENLNKVKFIHEHLPPQLQTPLKFKGDRKTFLEYTHGAVMKVFYPSSTTSPDTLARSLTSAILYIDEAAFIRHISEAYGSAQPTLSRARVQAEKNMYPYFTLITSTPNGSIGDGF